MSVTDTERFRRLLEEERGRVAGAIENLHRDSARSIEDETGEETQFDNHIADTATVTYEREMDYTLEENNEAVLAAIDRALARIEEGTYGTCQRCGKPIAEARLEAIPWTELCIDCKRELERR